MKLFEKVIIILAVAAGCAAIILVLTFTLAPGGSKEERALSPYSAPGEKEALVIYVSGEVFLYRHTAWKSVEIGERVTAGDFIKTFENAYCDLQFGEQAIISIRPDTAFHLDEVFQVPGGVRSDGRLLFGSLLYKVEKLAGADRVRVTAGSKAFGVRGTQFAVASRGDTTICGVRDGRVDVYAAGAGTPERTISAGQEVAVDEPSGAVGAVAALSRTRRDLLERLSELAYVDLAAGRETRLVKVAVRVEPASAEILLDGASAGFGSYAGVFTAGASLNLTLRKNGYREQSFTITPKPGDNRLYSFKLDLDEPDKGAGPTDRAEEYESRIKTLEGEYRKALHEKETVIKERDALKQDLEAGKKENARLSTELENANRKIREAADKLK
jgi:hypothetical protein